MGIIAIILYICSWVLAIFLKIHLQDQFATALLLSLFIISVGVGGFAKWAGHLFFSERVARYANWQHTPYQYETAVAHFTFAILGIIAFFYKSFWFSAGLGFVLFNLGNALVHITEMKKRGNFSIGNAGSALYMDLIVPLTMCVTFLLHSFDI